MAAALGARFLDGAGREIADGGPPWSASRASISRPMHPMLGAVSVVGRVRRGQSAHRTAGGERGLRPSEGRVARRTSRCSITRLRHLAAVVERDLGVALEDEPGAGAAGGLGFGLMAFCGAGLRPGIEVVSDAVGLAERIARADLVDHGGGVARRAVAARQGPGGCPRGVRARRGARGDRVRSGFDRAAGRVPWSPSPTASAWTRPSPTHAAPSRTPSRISPRAASALVGGAAMSGAIDRFVEARSSPWAPPAGATVPRGHEDRRRCREGDRVRRRPDREVARVRRRRHGRPRAHVRVEPGGRVEARRRRGATAVRRATPEEARAATGFAVGGTPPFGHAEPRPRLLRRGPARVTTRCGPPRARRIRSSPSPRRTWSG